MKTRQNEKQSKKRIFPLPLHVYLSYLAVCALLFTGVSFSSYLFTANGEDAARAAAGIVVVAHDLNTTIPLEPSPDSNQISSQFNFSVSNNTSEVAIRYDVVVTLDQALPDGITMQLDGKPCSGNVNNTYTFLNIGSFEAGTMKSFPHQLTFTGDFDTYNTPGEADFQIKISVFAEQID